MVTAMTISATALPASQIVAVGKRKEILVTSLITSNQIPLMHAQIPCHKRADVVEESQVRISNCHANVKEKAKVEDRVIE